MSIATTPLTSTIQDTYRQRTPQSAEQYQRARKSLPGGNTRQAAYWKPYPVFVDRARGTRLYDIDGNQYFDLTYNYTAMVHGHAYPPIVEAVEIERGTGWSANNLAMVDLAEQIAERVASVDQVRFTNSGTEGALLGLLIARQVTGRHKILMARHGYHGSLNEFESGTFDHPGPDTLLATYNDLGSFERVLEEHGEEIAGVWIEPVMGAGGGVPGTSEFLHGLRKAAAKAGALFVLDEVITFRLGFGGQQEGLGLDPDLTMFGKLIGGGFPVGAIGGSKELMKGFDPEGDMTCFHSGTYNANPVTAAAGAVSVRELTRDRIAEMHRLTERLATRLKHAADRAGAPLSIRRVGSMMTLYLSSELPASSMVRTDGDAIALFHLAAMNHGLLPAPRGMMVTSTVMTEEDVDEIAERTGHALVDVAREIA